MNAYAFTNSKGRTYYLHSRVTTLRNGKIQTIFFFAKSAEGALTEVPTGYAPMESRNGLPVLKKLEIA